MCKLCDTNRPKQKFSTQMSQTLIQFRNAVIEYTNEEPCKQCGEAYLRSLKHDGKVPALDIDRYIIERKLIPIYVYNSTNLDRDKLKKRKSVIFNNKYVTKHRRRTPLKDTK